MKLIQRIFSRGLSKKFFFLIYFLFILILIYIHGFRDQHEALKYTGAVKELASGNFNFLTGPLNFFSSYIFFLLPSYLLGNLYLTVFFQLLLSFAAGNCLYLIIEKITGYRLLGLIIMVLFLFSYFIQYWTISLFSESFFISVSVIFIYYTLNHKRNFTYFLGFSLFGLLVIFARPQGILFVLPCLFYYQQKQFPVSSIIRNLLFFLFSLVIFWFSFSRTIDCEKIFKPITESSIICGFPNTNFEGPLPEKCTILSAHQYLIEKHGILYELSLFVRKSISLFTFTRPYYSMQHNLLIGLNYLILLLSIVPLFLKTKVPAEVALFFKIILLNILLIGLTYDEWHGRYLAVMMPLLILLSAFTMERAIGLFRKKGNKLPAEKNHEPA